MWIKEYFPECESDFEITGTSYAGDPRSHTAMFVAKKVQHLLIGIEKSEAEGCLVFAETGCEIPDGLRQRHAVVECENPQLEYARFVMSLQKAQEEAEREIGYTFQPEGYYLSNSAVLGQDCRIEPGCVIGHGVCIGDRAVIRAGSSIRYASIGDDFVCQEHAVIGSDSFTMAGDEKGDKIRIPSMGRVRIGNHVEVGAGDHIARSISAETILEDHVKIDALTYIAHDVHVGKNAVITAQVSVAGFAEIGESAYIGTGAVIRNRVKVGAESFVGMGAVVTKQVEPGTVVVGNPARKMHKEEG